MEDKEFYEVIYDKIGQVLKSKGNNHPDSVQLMNRLNTLHAKNGIAQPGNTGGFVVIPPSIQIELNTIREHLEFRGDISIHYDFIKEDHWRKQLLADNIRMENTKLRMKGDDGRLFSDIEQFRMYCKYACFQIEFLLNYYFNQCYNFDFQLFKTAFDSLKSMGKIPTNYELRESKYINRVALELKLQFFLTWRHDVPNKQDALLEYMIAIKNIRNLESHRAVEKNFGASGGALSKPKLDETLSNDRDFKSVYLWLDNFVSYTRNELKSIQGNKSNNPKV